MAASNRRTVREAMVQTIFECEFRDVFDQGQTVLAKNLAEHALETYEPDFVDSLLRATVENSVELKVWIEKLAPEWPYSKIARLDRAVIQVALAELKYLGEKFKIPNKVIVSEYVEIAKDYGDDSNRRFVNGVLSSAKKELEAGSRC
jgi:N utilization substance protein B